MNDHPRIRFGRYELLRLLARGGMGEIHIANDTVLDRRVVIKRLRVERSTDQAAIDMFLDEARAGAKIAHPNIVKIYDLGFIDEQYFIAMEHLDGLDLRAFTRALEARGEMIPIPIAVRLMVDACRGLHAAHSATTGEGIPLKLVHRDISPQNLFVTRDGHLQILDFGIAKTAIQSRMQTVVGTIKGKMGYMSPEQCRGMSLDARSDLFSLGAVLYELLANQRLFQRSSYEETYTAILHEPIDPPFREEEVVPERLMRATMRALHRDPDLRFRSALDFGDELEAIAAEEMMAASSADVVRLLERGRSVPPLQAESVGAEADSVTAQRGSTTAPVHPRRHRSWRSALLGSAALGVAVMAAMAILRREERAPPPASPGPIVATVAPDGGVSAATPLARETEPSPTPVAPRSSASIERVRSNRAVRAPRRSLAPEVVRAAPTPRAATITIDARPWAIVHVNGVNLGPTPLVEHQLPDGPVTLRLVNAKLGIDHTETLTLRAGEIVKRTIELQPGK